MTTNMKKLARPFPLLIWNGHPKGKGRKALGTRLKIGQLRRLNFQRRAALMALFSRVSVRVSWHDLLRVYLVLSAN